MYKRVKVDHDFIYDQINLDKSSSIKVRPKITGAVDVNKAFIIDRTFVRRMLLTKMTNEVDKIIDLFSIFFDIEDEEESETAEKLILDQLERFRSGVIKKYQVFLKEKEIKAYLNKIEFLEEELQKKKLELLNEKTNRRTVIK